MNESRDFKVSYSKNNPNLTKQLDVVAIDDEVVLMIECKESERMNSVSWKKELESINGYLYSNSDNKGGVINELKTRYPNRKYVYIFATKNYVIGEQDKERMKDFKIINFEHDSVSYYQQLVAHLGTASRYQFLASIFSHKKIQGMDNRVPAIQGKMGGLTYYSFSIEPEKLLKIAYVLHRNNANRENMPTYQRIIKKDRLKSVREYINKGGFFPNSLIISIDSKSTLKFELANKQVENSLSKIGILYLPNTYQSAYIIDGQHRLYGYSDSNFSTSNSIPVVAFVNLDKSEQVKMFMDINENQKAVSKSLRNTLNIDMWWNSQKMYERNTALMLDIAQKLGEDKKSALYERIVTGENTSTEKRCITLEYIKDALNKTNFFSEYKKNNNELTRLGTFSKENNDATEESFIPFIKQYFNMIEEKCDEEWHNDSDGYLAINNTTFALIKILDDITNLYLEKFNLQVVNDYKDVFVKMQAMFDALFQVLNELPLEKRNDIKNAKGGAAKSYSWRVLQIALNSKEPSFTNEELRTYIKENCTDYENIIKQPVHDIKSSFVSLVKKEFEKQNDWISNLIEPDFKKALCTRQFEKHYEEHIEMEDIDIWDLVGFDDLKKMTDHEKNWTNYIQRKINENIQEKISKSNFIDDLKNLDIIDRKLKKKNTKVTSLDYLFVKKIIEKYSININMENVE